MRARLPIAACALAFMVVPVAGLAQQPRTQPLERPFTGLFRTGGSATLTSTLGAFGGFDHSRTMLVSNGMESTRASDGQYGGGTANLRYSTPMRQYAFAATGTAALRRYPEFGSLSGLTAATYSAGMTLGGPLGRRGTLRVTQNASATPFYQFNPFAGYASVAPETLALPTEDFRLGRGRTYSYDAGVGTDWRVGRRQTLALDYSLRQVRYPVEDTSILTNGGAFRYSRQATRTVAIVLGYGLQHSTTSRSLPSNYQRIDAGVQYHASIFSRTTTVSAATGAALVSTRDPQSGELQQVANFTVNAGIHHRVRQSLTFGVDYRREPQWLDLLSNPAYTDSVFASLQALPARRVTLSLSSGYSHAALDAGTSGRHSNTTFATARLSWRHGRALSSHVQYSYYALRTSAATAAVAPLARIDRQSVLGGLSWSLPLLVPGVRQ